MIYSFGLRTCYEALDGLPRDGEHPERSAEIKNDKVLKKIKFNKIRVVR
jgi:hypothetical protein